MTALSSACLKWCCSTIVNHSYLHRVTLTDRLHLHTSEINTKYMHIYIILYNSVCASCVYFYAFGYAAFVQDKVYTYTLNT